MTHERIFTERPLFGGAMSCRIPTAWRDVSDVRQVPDHQECWQEVSENDGGGGGSVLVIEVLEHQSSVTNETAADYFFRDLAGADNNNALFVVPVEDGEQDDGFMLRFQPQATPPSTDNLHLASPATTAATAGLEGVAVVGGIGYQTVAKGRDYDVAGNKRTDQEIQTIRIELCVIRLPNVGTDLLVSLSKPILKISNTDEKSGNSNSDNTDSALQNEPITEQSWSDVFQCVLSSFQIRDWELFG